MKHILVAIIVALFLFGVSSAWAHRHPAYSHDSGIIKLNSDWMGELPDFLRISELSIPGTHDTMALCGGDAVACQVLKQPVGSGIRLISVALPDHFDITPKIYKDNRGL
jgi:1-phosphatidylinositol phosphodiesterase